MTTNSLKCIQWNARGLTKSRLEEFRILLNPDDRDLIVLSETFWNNNFIVKLKNYSILKKDRITRRGGFYLKNAKNVPYPNH